MNLRNISLIVCLLPALALRVAVDPFTGGSSFFWTNRQAPPFKEQVDRIFTATNTVRAAKGKAPLQQDEKLMRAAQQYAELMAAQEELSHTIGGISLVEKAQRVGYSFRSISENIAFNTDLDGRFVVNEQWMKSKGHRQNLLADDISQIGIGIAGPSTRSKRYYYCQIFGTPLSGPAR
jgi:uncharacterized protein YkwD